jgi:hypothetical protein
MRGVADIANVRLEERVDIDSLTPHPENPRQGDVGAISASLNDHGFYGTVVAQVSTRRVLAGNHRIESARALGLDEVAVAWVDVDDDEARAIMLADNRSSDVAAYDTQALAELLAAIEQSGAGLDGTLYTLTDLDTLLAGLAPPDDGYGNVGDGLTPGEREVLREAGGAMRMLIFPFTEEEHSEVVERLGAARKRLGVETNSQVLVELLRAAADG